MTTNSAPLRPRPAAVALSVGPHLADPAMAETIAELAAAKRGFSGLGIVRRDRKVAWLPTEADVLAAVLECAERGAPMTLLSPGDLDTRSQRLLRSLREEGVPYMALRRVDSDQPARPGDVKSDTIEVHLPGQKGWTGRAVIMAASEAAMSGARVPPVRLEPTVAEAIRRAIQERRQLELSPSAASDSGELVAEGPRLGRP